MIEHPADWWNKPHERSGKTTLRFATYCPICGKTDSADHDRWLTTVKKYNGVVSYLEHVYTEEAERELNPATRTLPVFKTDGWCEKFVEIKGK